MSAIAMSFRIWFITVLLNALLYGVVSLLGGEVYGVLIAMVLFVVGFVITLPFWLVILVLIEIVMRSPYSATGRLCWLGGAMAAFVALFYACTAWLLFGHFTLNEPAISLLTGTTIAAIIAALFLSRKAFRKTTGDTFIANNQ